MVKTQEMTTFEEMYALLPVIYRQRDAEQGYPLKALIKVLAEQAHLAEADIQQLYENWFIETAEDWVVPYLGELVGYRLVHEAGQPGNVADEAGQALNKILIPRREVANTIRYRRRKGTLALLELLARDVAGWPARAVEFYRLLAWTQQLNHVRLGYGRSVNVRDSEATMLINTPFDNLAHTVDVRRINSHRRRGRYNIPNVGLFVWRLRSYPVSKTPPYYLEEIGTHCYTFSVLGNDSQLYTKPVAEEDAHHIANELNVPTPIRRLAFERNKTDYYGEGKSVAIWREDKESGALALIPAENILPADLTDWQYQPNPGQVMLDPELGRIAFSPRDLPEGDLRVSYHYGFSADIGGGEYGRTLSNPLDAILYRVLPQPETDEREFQTIGEALTQWAKDKPANAVIEIDTSDAYVDRVDITLQENQTLQLRAANHRRPVLRLLDYRTAGPDALRVKGGAGSHFILDGFLISGRGVLVRGDVASVTIRHSTLVPGWTLEPDCNPRRPTEPSLVLHDGSACIQIEQSILGSIQVNQDEVTTDPIPIRLEDSILDATDNEKAAVDAPGWPIAHATLRILRSTVFGTIQTHAIELAENSLFMGQVQVARRQLGCMRFCYVPAESRTPRRYNCQPDMVEKAAASDAAKEIERERVRPKFNSIRYGTATYGQLANHCAPEIKRGADDESEMGVFHHLYQPQREANLQVRLSEYTPADMVVGIIFAS